MTAPTAPNRADGAEGSDYATTPPTAPSPIGRGGGDGAVARTTAGSNLQIRTRRGPALAPGPQARPDWQRLHAYWESCAYCVSATPLTQLVVATRNH